MKSMIEKKAQYRKILKKSSYECQLASDKTYQLIIGKENISMAKNIVDSYIVAPVINSFVIWVLESAMKFKIKRLYFLARDAYIMYQCAKEYVSKCDIDIECRYLSCSRYSIRVPMYHKDMDKALEYITLGGIDLTWRKILTRAGLDNNMQEIMDNIGYKVPIDTKILPSELKEIKEKLHGNSYFMNMLYEKSLQAYETFDKYMKQEGIKDDVSMAIVDTGWMGTMQMELNKYINQAGNNTYTLQGFYWGLYEIPDGMNESTYHTYYFAPYKNTIKKAYFCNCLMEGIFTAPHGMTIGYKQIENVIYPLYEDISHERIKRVEDTLHTVKCFQNSILDIPDINNVKRIDKKAAKRLITSFMVYPAYEEAVSFGQLYFGDDVREYGNEYMASGMTEEELRRSHCMNKIINLFAGEKTESCMSAWYQGSAVLYSVNAKRHIRSYIRYQLLLNYRKNRKRIMKNGK